MRNLIFTSTIFCGHVALYIQRCFSIGLDYLFAQFWMLGENGRKQPSLRTPVIQRSDLGDKDLLWPDFSSRYHPWGQAEWLCQRRRSCPRRHICKEKHVWAAKRRQGIPGDLCLLLEEHTIVFCSEGSLGCLDLGNQCSQSMHFAP